jgi:TRAP-type mannitol/chloroaromatic compound transport system permease small subunit
MGTLSKRLRQFSELSGRAIAWLTVPMVVTTFVIVVLRYAFDLGWIWMQESVIWMHAVVFMLAGAYTLSWDAHVRVDIFYRGMSSRRKAWVNLLGIALFLMPVSVFLIATSWEYVVVSWQIHEGSREAGGLPYPFVPVLKSVIPLSFALLLIQGVADAIDNGRMLLRAVSADSGEGTGGDDPGISV